MRVLNVSAELEPWLSCALSMFVSVACRQILLNMSITGDDSKKLYKTLAKIATLATVLVFVESSIVGLCSVALHANFISTSTLINKSLAYSCLVFMYMSQLVTSITFLLNPNVTEKWLSRPVVVASLTALAGVECFVSLCARDIETVVKSTGMVLSCGMHFIETASSRSLLRSNGMLDAKGFLSRVDRIHGKLRDVAGRYGLGSCSLFAILFSLVYTFLTSESLRSSSAISYELAKTQWTRTTSFVSLMATAGANDRTSRYSSLHTRNVNKSKTL